MRGGPGLTWRVFPWDPEAEEGQPFSASHVPAGQGDGRFDLPGSAVGVLYLSQTREHAIAEKVQHLRNLELADDDLVVRGRRYALSSVELPEDAWRGLVDLCDPEELSRFRIGPDQVAARARDTTQMIAEAVHRGGHTGLRWWSAFFGEWHTWVLFRERLTVPLAYDAPRWLSTTDSDVRESARLLGIRLR